MKWRIQQMILASAATMFIVFVQGCIKMEPEIYGENEGFVEGTPHNISFKLDFSLPPLTKAIDENSLYNLNIYVVDASGVVITHKYCDYNSGSSVETEIYNNVEYTIYVVANAGKRLVAISSAQIENLIHSVESASEVVGESEEMVGESGRGEERRGVVMSGKTEPKTLSNGERVPISLKRGIAKIIFRADYSGLNEDVEINIKKVELKNAPKGVALFKESKISASEEATMSIGRSNTPIVKLNAGKIEGKDEEMIAGKIAGMDAGKNVRAVSTRSEGSVGIVNTRGEGSKGSEGCVGIVNTRGEGSVGVAGTMSGGVVVNPSVEETEAGIYFYQFENMQGNLLAGNTDQQEKVWPEGSINSQICSYLEITTDYSSAVKEGEVIYRFYLGKDMVGNFDVERNTQLTVTVSFNGDGNINENTWRVDNSQLTDVIIPEISFAQSNITLYDLEYANLPYSVLYPDNAVVTVTSSNPDVVKIIGHNSSGVQIQGGAAGEAIITAKIVGNSGSGSGEEGSGSSGTGSGEEGSGSSGTGSGGEGSGSSGSGSSGEGAVAQCRVRVEKLAIAVEKSNYTMYNHFYEDIKYTITPAHAAALGVKITCQNNSITTGYNTIGNRVIPQFPAGATLPAEEVLRISVAGREDVSTTVNATIKPILALTPQMQIIANKGFDAVEKSLGLDFSPRANVELSWVANDNVSIYGDPGEYIILSATENRATFPIPNGANGLYRLKAKVVGDDGYGNVEATQTDAVKYCDITVYETIYLVGISKTMNRERISTSPDKWRYENEIVAKWLAHPNSLLFTQGEVDLGIKYIYNGVEYEDNHTEQTETFEFTFENGEEIAYALDEGVKEYKGTAPQYYLEYFYLQAVSSSLVNGDMLTGTPFIHIYSRQFMSGFSEDVAPNWSKIFEYIYGK